MTSFAGRPRITAIEPQERDPERRSIFVDGRFVLGVALAVVESLGLHVGQSVTPEDLERIAAAEEHRRAREAAYLLLSYRARTVEEMRRRLARKRFAPELVDQTIEDLLRQGLLNDPAFADQWVQNRQLSRPSGKAMLRWELRQKGVDPEVTEEALAPLDEDAELAAARDLIQRRLSRTSDRDPEVLRQRLTGVLRRRGFSWEVARRALDEALAATDDDTWDPS